MIERLRPSGKKWPRGQSFRLTERGLAADKDYRTAIGAGLPAGGTGSLGNVQAEWAALHEVDAADGLVLSEFGREERTLAELAVALEPCGTDPREIKKTVERLIDRGILIPVGDKSNVESD